jgi:two-component system, cell cycle sensor histidine kinase and response regulator CckA
MDKANDLFLLLLNLSQMRSRRKIIELFIESISTIFAPWAFSYFDRELERTAASFPIATRNSQYGHIVFKDGGPLSEKDQSLLHNAVQMLAVVLERLDFEAALDKERSSMVQLADQRLQALQKTVEQLQNSRNDYIRLVEDLKMEISERKQVEEKLRKNEKDLRESQQIAHLGSWRLDLATGRVTWSEELYKMYGFDMTEPPPPYTEHVKLFTPESWKILSMALAETRATGVPYELELRTVRKDGGTGWMWVRGETITDSQGKLIALWGAAQDISERKQAEEEHEKLLMQLYQAQKMESVGRLAGGVAHDFNNMLAVILIQTEQALERVDPSQPLHADLMGIHNAAKHSANLTRQLLAFARKQIVAPKVLDLNETVEGMIKMLRRLIGEDIDLAWMPCQNPMFVKMDPSQIDQILANLCVNARDAIADTGRITIETGLASFNENYCAQHQDFIPGNYVVLAVSDNGCGMDAETRNKIFEPFFTTKELGKGTGLGLATVYGIVKQNEGFINVYSEPGHGTTFKIYMHRHADSKTFLPESILSTPTTWNRATILLVEDEPTILRIATIGLKKLGHEVLAANTPREAIRLAKEYSGRIDLLITDVVMPEMNGRDLGNHILSFQPDIKRLFMSGYTANIIAHHGVLEEDMHFIQKPFSMKDMEKKLREVLGQG